MNRFMQIAYDEAVEGMLNNEGGPFGAMIVKNGKVIATAHNEVLKSKDPTAHAEVNAIRKASQVLESFDLSGCELYTTCEPCPMCLGAIFWARITKVYFAATKEDAALGGFDDSHFYELIEKKELPLIQIDASSGKKLFSIWLEKSDAQIY